MRVRKTWLLVHFGSVTMIVVLKCQQFPQPPFCIISAEVITVKKAHNFFVVLMKIVFIFMASLKRYWGIHSLRFDNHCNAAGRLDLDCGEGVMEGISEKMIFKPSKRNDSACKSFEVGKVICVVKELQEQSTLSIVLKGKSNTRWG